jgi:hypothetical protein
MGLGFVMIDVPSWHHRCFWTTFRLSLIARHPIIPNGSFDPRRSSRWELAMKVVTPSRRLAAPELFISTDGIGMLPSAHGTILARGLSVVWIAGGEARHGPSGIESRVEAE